MSHNLPCSPQGGKFKPHLLYRQSYTRWDIVYHNPQKVIVSVLWSCMWSAWDLWFTTTTPVFSFTARFSSQWLASYPVLHHSYCRLQYGEPSAQASTRMQGYLSTTTNPRLQQTSALFLRRYLQQIQGYPRPCTLTHEDFLAYLLYVFVVSEHGDEAL